MARQIVITTDHEIFGNGSGDVRRHIVEPTEAMCRIGERYGVPITIFFELEEYLAFERHAGELRQELGYDPGGLMWTQAGDLGRRGHDLQLHIHPQWFRAKRHGGRWWLNQSTLTVDALFDSTHQTCRYIEERKARLEALSGRPVTAYRAGGFAAQPGLRLLEGLRQAGIVIDSSVVRGLRRALPHPLDFRSTPGGAMWRVATSVSEEDPAGTVWEVPIHSVMRRRWNQLTPRRLRAKFSRHVPREQQKTLVGQFGVGRSPAGVARFLTERVPIKLDYHNVAPRSLMKMIRAAPPVPDGEPDVLVMIGHSKEHTSDERFAAFLRLVVAEPDLEVVSFSELARQIAGGGRHPGGGTHGGRGGKPEPKQKPS